MIERVRARALGKLWSSLNLIHRIVRERQFLRETRVQRDIYITPCGILYART